MTHLLRNVPETKIFEKRLCDDETRGKQGEKPQNRFQLRMHQRAEENPEN